MVQEFFRMHGKHPLIMMRLTLVRIGSGFQVAVWQHGTIPFVWTNFNKSPSNSRGLHTHSLTELEALSNLSKILLF
jgi:hypothetical protein